MVAAAQTWLTNYRREKCFSKTAARQKPEGCFSFLSPGCFIVATDGHTPHMMLAVITSNNICRENWTKKQLKPGFLNIIIQLKNIFCQMLQSSKLREQSHLPVYNGRNVGCRGVRIFEMFICFVYQVVIHNMS